VGAPPRSDIDRLIELGLNRYGAGDLDGALLMWEEALAIDPHNARANSYLDYVRGHYEELSISEPAITSGEDEPFAIHEEPEYQIEITPGQLIARESQPMLADDDPIDAGWFDDEATHDAGARLSNDTLELEADEPPPPPEVNFDDATREYYGAPTRPSSPRPSQSEYVDAPHSEFEHGEYTFSGNLTLRHHDWWAMASFEERDVENPPDDAAAIWWVKQDS